MGSVQLILGDLQEAHASGRDDIIVTFRNHPETLVGRVTLEEGGRFTLYRPSEPTSGDKRAFKTRLQVEDVLYVTIPEGTEKGGVKK